MSMIAFKHACEIVWTIGFAIMFSVLMWHEFKSRDSKLPKRYFRIAIVAATWFLWVAIVAYIGSKTKPAKLTASPKARAS